MMRLMPILAVLGLSMSIEFVVQLVPSAPARLNLLLDAVIGVITIMVFVKILAERSWALIPAKYFLLMLAFTYVCITGLILNAVATDTAFAGTRYFFRYVPVVLLPFAFKLDESDQKFIFAFLVVILLVQLPVSILQRFVFWSDLITGDEVRGTYGSSSSIAVIGCIGLIFTLTFYIKGVIGPLKMALLSLALLIPPSLAEAKVTPILIAAGVAVLVWQFRQQLSAGKLVLISAATAAGVALFVIMYSVMYSPEEGMGYFDVMTDDRYQYQFEDIQAPELELNLTERTDVIGKYDPTVSIQTGREPGRIDSVIMPFQALWPNEPLTLLFGLGIGNMTSNFGDGGDYFYLTKSMSGAGTTISHLLWETGLLGCLLYMFFLISLVFDVLKYRQDQETFTSMIAMAMIPTSAIMGLTLIYTNTFFRFDIMIPYLFMMALVLADRRRSANEVPSRVQQSSSNKARAIPI